MFCVSIHREHGMVSVGFCVVNTLKRAYPLENATHIALSNLLLLIFNLVLRVKHTCRSVLSCEIHRDPTYLLFTHQKVFSLHSVFSGTVRRFLENHGENIETVVFAVTDVEEVRLPFCFTVYATASIL